MTNYFDDTIIAPATIPGTGAISLLRISGPESLALADKMIRFRHGNALSADTGSIKFGTLVDDEGNVLDDVLCSIFRAPRSYTGEDSVEISCHASSYIVSKALEIAVSAGARLANPGEFTRRAFTNGKMDLTQAEAVADVIASTAKASHHIALNQLKGGFSSELKELRAQLLQMASLLELELDFSEEDVEFAERGKLTSLVDSTLAKVNSLASSFRLGNAVKNGVPVAIVGAPNAGKSTLLNTILGEDRAIVSSTPGTTRDTIEECMNIGGVLFRFIDTAGVRESFGNDAAENCPTVGMPGTEIEQMGIERSFQSLHKADIVIILLDAVILSSTSSESKDTCLSALTRILHEINTDVQQVIFAFNKCDLYSEFNSIHGENNDNKKVISYNNFVSSINNEWISDFIERKAKLSLEISAKTGFGVKNLLSTLSELVQSKITEANDQSVLVTNIRHYEALVTASKQLSTVRSGLLSNSPIDIIAEDLRSALSTLGSITGEITHTDILENIFKNFCIGK